jgi:hypothetical protein
MLNKLIKLANHLDSKGLSKEADYLDNIILKYSNEAVAKIPPTHEAREWVVKNINEESAPKGIEPNPINLFAYAGSEEVVIKPGIINDDDGLEVVFDNRGSGTKEERENELEEMFPGITSPGGVLLEDGNIYSLKYESLGKTEGRLTMIYDLFM